MRGHSVGQHGSPRLLEAGSPVRRRLRDPTCLIKKLRIKTKATTFFQKTNSKTAKDRKTARREQQLREGVPAADHTTNKTAGDGGEHTSEL